MDGATKFVRGDAVAGIMIMVINIIGGLVVGVLQHDLDFGAAAKNYTLLTIGDGLVAQIPALVISTAAGIVVSRVGSDEDIGKQLMGQLFSRPQVLSSPPSSSALLGMIPGMPHFAFLLFAVGLGWLALLHEAARQAGGPSRRKPVAALVTGDAQEASWYDVAPVDALGLEVGYRLIPLVDKARTASCCAASGACARNSPRTWAFCRRRCISATTSNSTHPAYRITLKGVEIGAAEGHSGMFLAINPGRVAGTLPGHRPRDPAFGLPAVWIDQAASASRQHARLHRGRCRHRGRHPSESSHHTHAAELLGRQEAQQLLDHFAQGITQAGRGPGAQTAAAGQRAEGTAEPAGRRRAHPRHAHHPRVPGRTRRARQDPNELTALVRISLGRAIVQQIFGREAELPVIALEQNLEKLLMQAIHTGSEGGGIEPGLASGLLKQCEAAARKQEALGWPTVLLVPAVLRPLLARLSGPHRASVEGVVPRGNT